MPIATKTINIIAGCIAIMTLTACDGLFDGVYDDPASAQVTPTEGQLIIDATSWTDWYYISFDSLRQYVESGDSAGLVRAETNFTPYPIPTEETAGSDSTGMYVYWFDVFGKGLSVNEKRSFTHTAPQPEPAQWDIAIHRNNVRTNGGAVLETNFTSMDELPEQSVDFTGATFTPDEWTENEVWADQSRMLQSLIGSQGIRINRVLSGWLKIDIPPMPPKFTHNNHVFLIRLSSGRYAAVQLANYMNAQGTKCWLTVNYKYPY